MKRLAVPLPKLEMVCSYETEAKLLVEEIRRQQSTDEPLEILEAGCGNRWELDLEGINYRLTGLDLDSEALRIRQDLRGDLDHGIVGDLRTAVLDESGYDVIFNSFVLEHIDGASQVLDNFWRWLKPGGILLLRIPDRDSVHGFATRMTPFWFHVFFKKYVERVENAGKPGYDPYPTFYDKVVSRRGISDWCHDHGAQIVAERGSRYYFDHLGWLTLPINAIMRIVHALAFGRLALQHNNLTYVIRKPIETIVDAEGCERSADALSVH